jgi:GAF domain-containing protein
VCEHPAALHNHAMPDLTAVQNICGLLDRGEIDRVEFLEHLTRGMAGEIGCSRAAVRLLVHSEAGPALHTIALFDAASGHLLRVPDMSDDNAGLYFDALLRDGTIIAPDVLTLPAVAPFREGYLVPLQVRSLLDVSFSVNGVLYGAFSCEQVGNTMAWTQQQVNLLRQISARASLTLMHAINAQVDTAPGALWEPSTPNRLMTMPMSLDGGKSS